MESLIHQQVGHYKITARMGMGGFGTVYLATHVKLGTEHAIKIPHIHIQEDPELRARFEQEAQIAAQLRHPNIARVTDFGESEKHGCYFVMDLLEGSDLGQALKEAPRFPLKAIKWLLQQLCSALDYIHQKKIYHRDIKPTNIFLSTDESGLTSIKLLDFGIAASRLAGSMTRSGVVMGSALYMAPEQAEGDAKRVDGRADLYALAVILYQLLSGLPPFQGNSYASLLKAHLLDPPPLLQVACVEKSWAPELNDFLQKALKKDASQRYPDAKVFWEHCLDALHKQEALESTQTPDEVEQSISPTSSRQTLGVLAPLKATGILLQETGLLPRRRMPGAELAETAALLPTQETEEQLPAPVGSSGISGERVSAVEKKPSPPASSSSKWIMLAVCSLMVVGVLGWMAWDLDRKPKTRPFSTTTRTKLPSKVIPHPTKQTRSLPATPAPSRANPRPDLRQVAEPVARPLMRLTPVRVLLVVQSKPSGALVWMRRKKQGKTPLILRRFPGEKVQFTLQNDGYAKRRVRWRFGKAPRVEKTYILRPLFQFWVRTKPSGADIKCGDKKGKTPYLLQGHPGSGVVHCTISRQGYQRKAIKWRPSPNSSGKTYVLKPTF